MKSWMGNSYICSVMKKVLIIAIAAMCVVACGPRRSAKSQATQKEAEQSEQVQHACCGHHAEAGCPAEAVQKECEQAVGDACQKVEEACEKVEEACEKAEQTTKKAARTVQKECETVKSEGMTVVPLGKKADPKPIKPVPKPVNK